MILFAVLFPLFIGYLIICFIYRQSISFLEKIALGFLVGTSFITVQMFAYSIVGIKFSVLSIILPWCLLLSLIGFADKKVTFGFKDYKQIEILLVFLILIKVLYVFFEALIKPVVGFDSLWNFSLRAKIFFFEKTVPLFSTHPYFLGAGMKSYPLHLPLLEAWNYLSMNTWDDVQMKIIFPVYFCALLIIFYQALLREKSRIQSLFFVFLLSSLPLLAYHATIEYADFVLGTYFLGAVIYLYEFFKSRDVKHLFVSSLLAASCGWIKEEGLILYLICFLVFFACNRFKSFKNIAVYLAPFFVFIFPWFVARRLLGLEFGNDTVFEIEKLFYFHQETIGKILYKIFLTDNWHLFPIAMVVLLIFYFKDIMSTNKKYILACFALVWGFFMYLYLFTYNAGMVMSDIILSRNCLVYFPVGLYLIGLTFSITREKQPGIIDNSHPSSKKRT